MRLHAVILAGGRGERFWPLSRRLRPKQLLPLTGSTSLLEATVRRALQHLAPSDLWLASSIDLRPAIESLDLPVPPEHAVWETDARNTAPALGAVAELCTASGGGALLVIPSDHCIPDPVAWWRVVSRGAEALEGSSTRVVTFGLRVTRPETGYGYIERGDPFPPFDDVCRVARFHEKPSPTLAERYLAGGRHVWNSGIFLFDAAGLTDLLRRHEPRLREPLDTLRAAIARGVGPDDWKRFFSNAPSISIDYAVAERAADVVCVDAGFEWSDLGSWPAWAEQRDADSAGNVSRGEVLALEASNCVLYSEDGGLLAVLGIDDLVVVRVGDATLVCPRARAQDVKLLLEEARRDERLARYL